MYFNKIQWVEKETGRNTLLLTGIFGTPYKLHPLAYKPLVDFNNCVVCWTVNNFYLKKISANIRENPETI